MPEKSRIVVDLSDGVEVDTETLAMLAERIAEAGRGELVDGAEVIRRLREHQYAEVR